MPAPQAEALGTSARQTFAARNIALPTQWKSMGPQYPDAFGHPELWTPANAQDNLYHEATLNKYHTQAARILGRGYEQYIDGVCAAICGAIEQWMRSASIVSVNLAGTIGTVAPGATIGPQLKPLIMPAAPQSTRQEQKYSLAIAGVLSDSWQQWQQGLSGILTYPPAGPPGPNIPAPLISFSSAGEADLAPDRLTEEMLRRLDAPGALHARDLFVSIAQAFFTHFQIFKTSTLISGVIMTLPAPPAPPIAHILQAEHTAAEASEFGIDQIETQAETALQVLEPTPKPIPSGVVIPTPGNFT